MSSDGREPHFPGLESHLPGLEHKIRHRIQCLPGSTPYRQAEHTFSSSQAHVLLVSQGKTEWFADVLEFHQQEPGSEEVLRLLVWELRRSKKNESNHGHDVLPVEQTYTFHLQSTAHTTTSTIDSEPIALSKRGKIEMYLFNPCDSSGGHLLSPQQSTQIHKGHYIYIRTPISAPVPSTWQITSFFYIT